MREADETVASPGWSVRRGDNGSVVTLSGDWLARRGMGADHDAIGQVLSEAGKGPIVLETKELGRWDSALLVFVAALRQGAEEAGVTVDESALPDPVHRLLALTATPDSGPQAAPPRQRPLLTRFGQAMIGVGTEAVAVMNIFGETILRGAAVPSGRVRMRWADLTTCMYDAGVAALPVVTVINLLVGCILAFVGAVQLRRFGGDIYVAALVGIAMAREMAALMTAIAMSGRTGGAYAAHIATMQGSEEIDALRAIGIPVYDYLILPRIAALTLMMPLLYLYGCAVGIFGGFLVSIAMMNVTTAGFIQQTQTSLAVSQIYFGLGKSIAFGLLIGIAGCRTGLRAGRSAADVGHAATTAVVVGIVGVIALDAIFAVCANALSF